MGDGKKSIQAAVDLTASGDVVLVSNGVYNTGGRVISHGMTNRVAITNAITVQSVNGPAVTIIQGNGPIGPSAVRCVYLGTNARLNGFTLTNGHTVVTNFIPGASGGGVYALTSSFITNCVIVGNSAWISGGGVYAGTVTVSVIAGNYARSGGGGADVARLIGCVISNNTTDTTGGGFSGGWAVGCTITRNSAGTMGGGVHNGWVSNCIVSYNTAVDRGGGVTFHARNSAIFGNTAGSQGGGVYSGGTGVFVLNCTVVGNRAAAGGGIHGPSVTNSIVYHNWATEDENWGPGAFGRSCLFPLPPGTGNIDTDPVLAGVYRIAPGSACVGAGSVAFSVGPDIDGEAWNIPPSMGCDEVNVGSLVGALDLKPWASSTNVPVGYPIRFIAEIGGRVTSSRWNFADGTILTNRAAVQRSYSATGVYAVVLTAFNETFTAGVSATVTVQVVPQQIHYVRLGNPSPLAPYTNWTTAATNIQDAIDAATQIGALVLVSNGTYSTGGRVKFGGLTNRVVVDKPITVQSINGPAFTAIVGAGPTGAAAVRCVWVGNDAVLSGFTLTNGHTHATGDITRARSGGGAWCEPLGIISNCVFVGNLAEQRGGGAMFGLVDSCVFTNNRAGLNGGGVSDLTARKSLLTGNRAQNGGGANQSTLMGCQVIGNEAINFAGGVYFGFVRQSVLAFNRAGIGGGADSARLLSSALFRNYASGTGGGANACRLTHCTVVYNSAVLEGGGTYGSVHTNSIIYFNTGPGAFNNHANSGPSRNSCTEPVLPGVGNVSFDPALASLTHLSGMSPLLGLGLTNAASGVDDIDGEPWSQPPDIGCDELTSGTATGSIAVAIRASAINLAVGARVEFQADIEGRLTNSVWTFGDGSSASNRPIYEHRYASTGSYTVVLTAYNDTFPGGISTSIVVNVASQVIHYVRTDSATPVAPFDSWDTAATNIQQAINAATQVGALILVSNGTYNTGGSVQRGISTNRVSINKPVTVRSVNGPAFATIQGGVGVRGAYVGTNATLSGFTITQGRTPTAGAVYFIEDYCGGGVWSEASGEVTNCMIVGNTAESSGGGLFGGVIRNSAIVSNTATTGQGGGGSMAIFYQCQIISNRTLNTTSSGSGGGVSSSVLYESTLAHNRAGTSVLQWGGGADKSILINCIVRTNVAERGGGVSGCIVSNSLIEGNAATQHGGGANVSSLHNCTIVSNVAAQNGGGLYEGSVVRGEIRYNRAVSGGGAHSATCILSRLMFNSATLGGGAHGGDQHDPLINCIVFGNSATNGGGVCDISMYSTTVAGNTASGTGGGYYMTEFGGDNVINCIIMSNSAPSNANWYAEFSDYIRYTCTIPTGTYWLAAGTFVTNSPLFVDLSATNLRLQASSPCIDAGTDIFVFLTAVDFDENPRISGGTVDLGAYEFQSGFIDTDGDGIPDWWETLYYGGPTNAHPGAMASNGVNTVLQAWIADLNPLATSAQFQVTGFSNLSATAQSVVIHPTSTARVYRVFGLTNLALNPQSWIPAGGVKTGTGAALEFTVTNAVPWANYHTTVEIP